MPDLERQLNEFLMRRPVLGKGVFIAPGAVVIGHVTLGDFSSVWYNAVLRGDINKIVVGHHTNIQDNCVLHLSDTLPCILGNYVTIGHAAIVHACTVEDGALIGMNATILDGAVVGRGALIGANSLISMGTQIPPGTLAIGAPAKIVRQLEPDEQALIESYAEKYARAAQFYLSKGVSPVRPELPAL